MLQKNVFDSWVSAIRLAVLAAGSKPSWHAATTTFWALDAGLQVLKSLRCFSSAEERILWKHLQGLEFSSVERGKTCQKPDLASQSFSKQYGLVRMPKKADKSGATSPGFLFAMPSSIRFLAFFNEYLNDNFSMF